MRTSSHTTGSMPQASPGPWPRRASPRSVSLMYPSYVPHWIADVEVVPAFAPGATAGKPTDATFEKRNPATGAVIAQVARGGAAEVAHALSSAAGAADAWARTPVPKRGAILGRAAELLREREKEFGEVVQAETGKPWKNAVAEV